MYIYSTALDFNFAMLTVFQRGKSERQHNTAIEDEFQKPTLQNMIQSQTKYIWKALRKMLPAGLLYKALYFIAEMRHRFWLFQAIQTQHRGTTIK